MSSARCNWGGRQGDGGDGREGGEGQDGEDASHDTLRNLDIPPCGGQGAIEGF